MVLMTKNRLDGLPIYTYDQIGQGRINNPNTNIYHVFYKTTFKNALANLTIPAWP